MKDLLNFNPANLVSFLVNTVALGSALAFIAFGAYLHWRKN